MTTVVRMNSAEQRKTAYVTSALFFLVQEGTVFFFLFFYTYSLRACIVLCTEVFFLLISNAIQSERSEVFFFALVYVQCAQVVVIVLQIRGLSKVNTLSSTFTHNCFFFFRFSL